MRKVLQIHQINRHWVFSGRNILRGAEQWRSLTSRDARGCHHQSALHRLLVLCHDWQRILSPFRHHVCQNRNRSRCRIILSSGWEEGNGRWPKFAGFSLLCKNRLVFPFMPCVMQSDAALTDIARLYTVGDRQRGLKKDYVPVHRDKRSITKRVHDCSKVVHRIKNAPAKLPFLLWIVTFFNSLQKSNFFSYSCK